MKYQFLIDAIGCIIGVTYSVTFFRLLWENSKHPLWIRLLLYLTSGTLMQIAPTTFRNTGLLALAVAFAVFIISFAFRATMFLRIYYSFVILIATSIGELYSIILMRSATGLSIEELQNSPQMYFATSMLVNLIQLLLITLALLAFKDAMRIDANFQRTILLLPLTTILMIALFLVLVGENVVMKYSSQIFCVMTLLIVSNLTILSSLEKKYDYEREHDELLNARARLKRQIDYCRQLYSRIYSAHEAVHDVKNHLIALSGFLKGNQVEKALNYIQSDITKISTSIKIISTGFPTLDAVLQQKLEDAQNYSTKIDMRISLPKVLHIDEVDLSTIVGNALDNAIEEMPFLSLEKRTIYVVIYKMGDRISITVENNVHRKVNTNRIVSSKSDRISHGHGIKNIKLLAEKYEGLAITTCSKHQFELLVLLKDISF